MLSNNNESEHLTSHRCLSESISSPLLRRSKSVRASFRMLGARWKSSSSGANLTNGGLTKIDDANKSTATNIVSKGVVSERFGKDFNRNVKKPTIDIAEHLPSQNVQLAQPPLLSMKNKSKLFHAFHAKENVNQKQPFQCEIPRNVAPKAAALLQIPTHTSPGQSSSVQHNHRSNQPHHDLNCPHHLQHQRQQQQYHSKGDYKRHDIIRNNENFQMTLDRNKCGLITNSKQFELLKTLSSNNNDEGNQGQNNYRDFFKPATIRRTPYWTNNQPMMHSKIF